MTAHFRTRPRVGDVIEISTPRGMAYAHYTHKHAQFGALLRVLPGLFSKRPQDLSGLVDVDPQFMTFFPLGAACNRKIVEIVGNTKLPERAKSFPIFRDGVASKEGRVQTWWLWDGEKEWKIGDLLPGMEHYPIRGVWNDTLLIERIVEGWTHADEI